MADEKKVVSDNVPFYERLCVCAYID